MKKDIVIIPTYNERDTIGGTLSIVVALCKDVEIIVVDDNSPDGTAGIVSDIATINPQIKLIVRPVKTGLGSAYKETLFSLTQRDDIRYIVTMDADGSHDPHDIGRLFAELANCDMCIGSRYIKGGGVTGWSTWRMLLSRCGNLYVGFIMGMKIKDATAGFVAYRFGVIRNIDITTIASSGYSYQIEFKSRVVRSGFHVREIPIIFHERRAGQSKMSGQIILEGIMTPWRN